MTLSPAQTWALILGLTIVVLLVHRGMDGWLGRMLDRTMRRNASFALWDGEPGTRPPKGHKACRDCGYFYPHADLDREGVCLDCKEHDMALADALDYAYEHDAIFVVEPCSHSAVEWLVDEEKAEVTLICSVCRVDLVTEAFDEWLAPVEPEQEDHR